MYKLIEGLARSECQVSMAIGFSPWIPAVKPAPVLTVRYYLCPNSLIICVESQGQVVDAALLLNLANLVIVGLGAILSGTSFKGLKTGLCELRL